MLHETNVRKCTETDLQIKISSYLLVSYGCVSRLTPFQMLHHHISLCSYPCQHSPPSIVVSDHENPNTAHHIMDQCTDISASLVCQYNVYELLE